MGRFTLTLQRWAHCCRVVAAVVFMRILADRMAHQEKFTPIIKRIVRPGFEPINLNVQWFASIFFKRFHTHRIEVTKGAGLHSASANAMAREAEGSPKASNSIYKASKRASQSPSKRPGPVQKKPSVMVWFPLSSFANTSKIYSVFFLRSSGGTVRALSSDVRSTIRWTSEFSTMTW